MINGYDDKTWFYQNYRIDKVFNPKTGTYLFEVCRKVKLGDYDYAYSADPVIVCEDFKEAKEFCERVNKESEE